MMEKERYYKQEAANEHLSQLCNLNTNTRIM